MLSLDVYAFQPPTELEKNARHDSIFNVFKTIRTADQKLRFLKDAEPGFFLGKYTDTLRFWTDKTGSDVLLVEGNCNLKLYFGVVLLKQEQPAKALEYLLSCEDCALETTEDSIQLNITLSKAYEEMGYLEGALMYHYIGLEIAKRNNGSDALKNFPRISGIYYNLGYPLTAARELIALKKYEPWKYGDANNVGIYYLKAGFLDSAIFYFNVAYDLAVEQTANKEKGWFAGLVKGNLGQAYLENGEYEKAIPHLQFDIERSLEFGVEWNAFISYYELARCYMELGNFSKANRYIHASELLYDPSMNLDRRMGFFKTKSDILFKEKKYDSALYYSEIYHSIKDSAAQQYAINKELGIVMIFDLQRKNREIDKQRNELIQIQLEASQYEIETLHAEKTNRIYSILIIVLFVVVCIILIYIYLRNQRQKELIKKNQVINDYKNEIEKVLSANKLSSQETNRSIINQMIAINDLLPFNETRKGDMQSLKMANKRLEIAGFLTKIYTTFAEKGGLNKVGIDVMLAETVEQFMHQNDLKGIQIFLDAEKTPFKMLKATKVAIVAKEFMNMTFQNQISKSEGIKGWLRFEIFDHSNCRLSLKSNIQCADNIDQLEERAQESMAIIKLFCEQLNARANFDLNEESNFYLDFRI